MTDLSGSFLTILTVLVFLVFSESLAKLEKITKENARKMIHISVGNVIFFVPLFETRWIAAGIPFIFVFGNFLLSPMSPIKKLRLRTFQAGHAWGTILYPMSLAITVFVFFDFPWLIVAAFFPVVYGDGFAAVFGPKAKTGLFSIYGSSKTVLGTLVISLFSWGSVAIGILVLNYSLGLAIITASFISMLSPLIEVLSPKGTDNFVLPISLSVVLTLTTDFLQTVSSMINPNIYFIGVIVGLVFGIGGYFLKILTIDGAIAGFIIATMMFGLGGYVVGLQLFLFFALGSGATKIVKSIAGSTQDEFEKGGEKRDAIQGIAKAGIPAILSFTFAVTQEGIYFLLLTGIMSASLIDTMSTEIGIATHGAPVKVLKPWRKAKTGETGVISFRGTIGGILFGLLFVLIVFISLPLDDRLNLSFTLLSFTLALVISGTLGMLTDSVLGDTFQRQNKCLVCDKTVEASIHHNQPTVYDRGIKWFNNDVTNILGSSSGGLCMYLLLLLF